MQHLLGAGEGKRKEWTARYKRGWILTFKQRFQLFSVIMFYLRFDLLLWHFSISSTYFWIIWRVILDNPVNFRNIQSSGSDISAQQYSRFCITELEKCCSTFGLFLLALKGNTHIKGEVSTKKNKNLPTCKLKSNFPFHIFYHWQKYEITWGIFPYQGLVQTTQDHFAVKKQHYHGQQHTAIRNSIS